MRRRTNQKRGFTLIEMLVAMVISTILLMGMGGVLVAMFGGMRDSASFADATGRVDLIRQLTFDARTGNGIVLPAANGSGAYAAGGFEGHRVQFVSVFYDPVADTEEERLITWQSARATTADPDDPYTVQRFVDFNDGNGNTLTFGENDILNFEIERTSNRNFTAAFSAEEGGEEVSVQLSVTLRNVIN